MAASRFMFWVTRSLRIALRQSWNPSRAMASDATVGSPGPVENIMREKLTTLLQPSKLIITNESQLHRHHAAMRSQGGGNGETHFAVQVISDAFQGKNTVQRHRLIYSALSDEFAQGLHALSLNTKTAEEAQRFQAGN
ncbi:bola-like protein-domain-containing protein [Suillus paluster]|uniref:bola-like protein-domain-containing protein n=1 Tax=Suillus paluster TaxID=48578 RepID=UPI001B869885|nr:bola-like protein-domain-containing protein [Suillus paluster]KAG1734708.1 bola-like protein-domain-containing protein [Suillus paluster]